MPSQSKILYIITKSNYGGAQRYVHDLTTLLPKDRFEAVVALGGTGKKDAPAGALAQKLQNAGVRTIQVPYFMRNINPYYEIRTFFSLLNIIRVERPNIVHVNSSKAGGLGALAARLCGVSKIVYTIHGLPHHEPRGFLSRFVITCLTWITIIIATDAILLTEHERTMLKHWPLTRKRLRVIPNGIEAPDFMSHEEVRRELLSLANLKEIDISGKILVGTIAEMVPNKGLHYAVNAFRDLPKTHYFIIGDGEERSDLEKASQDTENVSLLGYVPDASHLLKAFDIFLLPSLKEGLPYVLLEAGYSGLTVVATKTGGIPELIKDGESGVLIKSADEEEIARAIKHLIKYPTERSDMANALNRKVLSGYRAESMMEKTLKIYNQG